MSNSSPLPPPLPPPTVPSRTLIMHPPPPQPKHPSSSTTPSLSTLLDQPSPVSPATSTSSQSQSSADPIQKQKHLLNEDTNDNYTKKRPRPTCCCQFRLRPQPHHIHETARSSYLDTRLLLFFRLAVTAILLGHLVFFSLRGDFSYRLYSTWNYAGLSVAFCLILTCSLLDILRDEDSTDDPGIGETQGEGMITDVERQPVGRQPLPDPKLARALTFIAVPLYYIFVTATLFGTIVYWAAIFDSSIVSISYPLMILKVFAPAAALLDFLLSLRMRFRLVYTFVYTFYNGIYVVALFLFDKLLGDPVYPLFDPSVQSSNEFIAKTVGIGAASVVAGLLMYGLSYLPVLSCFTGRRKKVPDKRDSVDSSEVPPTTTSEATSGSLQLKSLEGAKQGQENSESDKLLEVERKQDSRNVRASQKNDRLSLPLSGSMTKTQSGDAKWFRSSSARFVSSRSGGSIGSDGQRDSIARSDSETRSAWDELEQPAVQLEDEYFAMPSPSGEREVIKLQPIVRNESVTSLPGLLSRSGSGKMLRSASYRLSRPSSYRIARSGSGTSIVRSGSGTSIVRSGSGTSIVRSQSNRSDLTRAFPRNNSGASIGRQ